MKKTFKDLIYFLTDGIWRKDEDEYKSKTLRWLVKQLRVFIFTIKSYGQDQLQIRSAALTYYTLMGLVPIAAVIFGVAKGFTVETSLTNQLYESYPEYTQLIDQVLGFANALLERTKGGWIASIGLVILLWSVIMVFNNIERSFNHIWEVKKERKLTRKLSDYLSVVLVAPIFLFLSNNVTKGIGTTLYGLSDAGFYIAILDFFEALLPYLVIWVMFTVVYYVMPNTKVRFSAALKGALIAGTALRLFTILYITSQMMLSRYNAIYGSFAALPLFLLFLNVSWQVILFGAELSFGYQNIKKYVFEQESYHISLDYRRRVILVVLHRIADNFSKGGDPYDSDQLAQVLNIPVRIVRDVLFDLEQARLIVSIDEDLAKSEKYLPFRDLSNTRVMDIFKAIEQVGYQNADMEACVDLRSASTVIEQIEALVRESDRNVLLSELKSGECDEQA